MASICVVDAKLILKSAGQALLSEVMSVYMALKCGCSVPFSGCVDLLL